jgi:hypothetical protein
LAAWFHNCDKTNTPAEFKLRPEQRVLFAQTVGFLVDCVAKGTQVRTDGWKGYNGLEQLGYRHPIARSTAEVGDNLLPLANRVASLLKRWLLGTHQGAVNSGYLDYYLDEYTFRFNRRTSRSRGLLFYRLMQQAVELEPVQAKDIVAGRTTAAHPNELGSLESSA